MGLDIVEIFMAVESDFGIVIPDTIAPYLGTIGAAYDFVVTHMEPSPDVAPGTYSGALWERYLDVIEREVRVPRSALLPSARFVRDLGLD